MTTIDTAGDAEQLHIRHRETIARLNDETRQGTHRSSRIVMTAALRHFLCEDANTPDERFANEIINQRALMRLINETPIDPGNDPHGERDFGAVTFKGEKIFWKIDYYANDGTFCYGSEAPWDASKTIRMLTIMLASDY